MPPFSSRGKWENRGVVCKVFYKKIFFRLPRALEKYRKLVTIQHPTPKT